MDRRQREQARLACQISIGLMAGIFSILPSASAAPVQDTSKSFNNVPAANITTSGTTTNIEGPAANGGKNVIAWKDFSIKSGETVQFDKGAKTQNYLNVVTEANPSNIHGMLKGGNDVYIVNPNGVLFGEHASVDVGNLYVSTQDTTAAVTAFTGGKTGAEVIAGTANADVVNLGTINATNVAIKGTNITFSSTSNVTAAKNITLTAAGDVTNLGTLNATSGNITINSDKSINLWNDSDTGKKVKSKVEAQNITLTANEDVVNFGTLNATGEKIDISGANIKLMDTADVTAPAVNLTASGKIRLGQKAKLGEGTYMAMPTSSTYTTTGTVEHFGTIKDASDLAAVKDNLSGDFEMANDVKWNDGATNAPLGDDTTPFTGTFDGNYYAVNGITVSGRKYGGLFGYAKNATIKNVGVRDGSVEAEYAGGIVGKAEGTITGTGTDASSTMNLKNVYNEGVKVTPTDYTSDYGTYQVGGIAGGTNGVIIDTAYNTGTINDTEGGGIIGRGFDTTVKNAYNIMGSSLNKGAFTASGDKDQPNTFSNVYTTGSVLVLGTATGASTENALKISDVISGDTEDAKSMPYKASSYTGKLDGVSNSGSDDTTWRIYEGHSLPLLRAFLRRGRGTVRVNYDYEMGDSTDADFADYYQSGSNHGKDITPTYNSQAVSLIDGTTTFSGAVTDTPKISSATSSVSEVNQGTQALFYTGQHGYDLVGNNVTIQKRKVTISASSLPTGLFEKTYDGTTDTDSAKLTKFVTGGSAKTSGLIPYKYDKTHYEKKNTLTGTFDTKNVGTNKTITLKGGLVIANVDGHDNYDFGTDETGTAKTKGSADYTGKTILGQINKAQITISMKSGKDISREYKGKKTYAVKDEDLLTKDTASSLFTTSDPITVKSTDSTGATSETTDDVYVTVKDGVTSGDYGTLDKTTGKFTNVGTAGDHDVRYQGVILGGTDAGNYELVDTDGKVLYSLRMQNGTAVADGATGVGSNINTDGATFYTTGEITPKTIRSDSFGIKGVTKAEKEYDNTPYYDVDGKKLTTSALESYTEEGKTTYDDVNFTMTKASTGTHVGHSAWFTKDGADVSDAGSGYDITYNVQVSGTDAGNYQIVEGTGDSAKTTTLYSDKTVDAAVTGSKGSGEITKRSIYLKANTGANKQYDGDNLVKVDGKTTFDFDGSTTGRIVYDYRKKDGETDDASKHQLISDDGSKITYTGTYDAGSDVVYDKDGNPAAQNITYAIKLSGKNGRGVDASNNYAIYYHDGDTAKESTSLSGVTGTINPRKITVVKFADVSKTYDGNNKVDGKQKTNVVKLTGVTLDTSDKASFTTNSEGLLGSDSISALFKTDDIGGTYGTYDSAGKFTANEGGHVIDEGGKQQDVQYTSVALNKKGNYVLDSSTQKGKGTIKPLSIKDVTVNHKDITKVYDGTSNVATKMGDLQNTAATAASYITSVTAKTKSGSDLGLSWSVSDGDAYYIDSKGAKASDVTKANKARFLFDLKSSKEHLYDYTFDMTKTSDGKVQKDIDGAKITPRTLLATVKDKSGVTKTYDGKTALDKTGDDIVTLTDVDKKTTGLKASDDTNTSTGAFVDKNVAYDHMKDASGADKGYQKKDIYYYVTLNDGDTTKQGNYTVYAADTYTSASVPGTKIDYATKSDALKGQGTITAKTLKLGFDTVSKTFTNTTALTDGDIKADAGGTVGDVTSYGGLVTAADKGTSSDDDVKATTDISKSHYDTVNAGIGTKTVTYNVTLDGDDVTNYRLADGEAPLTKGETRNIDVTGNTINQKKIKDSDITTTWTGTIEKTYDGSENVAYDHSKDSNYLDKDDVFTVKKEDGTTEEKKLEKRDAKDFVNDITFAGISLNDWATKTKSTGYTVKSATYKDQNAGDGKEVTYKFNINSDFLKNFDLTDTTGLTKYSTTDKLLTETTTGNIKKKYFTMDFTPLSGHTQVYNGAAAIVNDSTGKTVDLSPQVTVTKGIIDGTTKDKLLTVSGAYEDENAGTGKNINYAVTLNNDNYQFYPKGTDGGKGTLSTDGKVMSYKGTGDITKKKLTVTDATLAEKYFDNNANVKDVGGITFTLDGLVSKDSGFTLDKKAVSDNLTGTYDSAHVNRKSTLGKAGTDSQGVDYYYQGVTYKGFQNVLDAMFKDGKDDDVIAGNYTIADTKYFDEAKQRGVIKPISITSAAIREDWNKITKTYDANDKVAGGNLTEAAKGLQYTVALTSDGRVRKSTEDRDKTTDTIVPIAYDLESATYEDGANAGKNLTAKYVIKGFTGTSFGDFDMGKEVEDVVRGPHKKTGDSTTDVSITPKVINVELTKSSGINKTYDTTAKSDYANSIKIDDGKDDGNVAGEPEASKISVKLVNDTVDYDGKDAGNHNLTYTVKLFGNDKGNYTLGAIDDTTGKGTQIEKALEATGTINKRKVYVDFAGGTAPTKIDKEYGTSYEVKLADDGSNIDEVRKEADPTHRKDVALVGTDGTLGDDTGILDKEVTLNNDAIKVAYKDGNAIAQDVLFTNIGLTDGRTDGSGNAKNYEIAYAPKARTVDGVLAGQGTITPKKITITYDNASEIKKTYDGSSALEDADIDATKETLNKAATDLILKGDTLNFTVAGKYTGTGVTTTDADGVETHTGTKTVAGKETKHANRTEGVGNGELGVKTTLNWSDGSKYGNYDVSFKAADAGRVFNTADSSIFATTINTVQGTIDPREIKVDGTKDASKTYDGTATVFAKDAAGNVIADPKRAGDNIKFTNVVAGDDVGATAKGEYQAVYGGDAADATDGTKTLEHKVKYTDIAVGNTDYELVGDKETTGKGTIDRRTLTLTGNKQTITSGESPAPYDGKTTGWVKKDEYDEKLQGDWNSHLRWDKNPGDDTTVVGTHAINGWYKSGDATTTTETSKVVDPKDSSLSTTTTTIKDSTTGKPISSEIVQIRTTEVPDPTEADPAHTKTVTTILSTTKTLTNPVNGDVYTTVLDGMGKVTSMTLTHTVTLADGTTKTTTTPVSSIEDWYGTSGTAYLNKGSGLSTYILTGNFDKNYQFVQDAGDGVTTHGNAEALTVVAPHHGGGGGGGGTPSTPSVPSTPSTPSTPVMPVTPVTPTTPPVTPTTPTVPTTVPDISEMNAAKRFVPDTNAYNYASHDEVQSVTRSGQAGLEYASGGINVLGETGTPDVKVSSADNAAIGLQNAGSVVNLSGGDAMEVSASRVDLTGGDSFTITGDTEVVRDSSAAIESAGAQTYEGSAAVETADAGTYDGSAAVESTGARTDLQSTTDASWLFGDEASASERQSGTSSSSSSSEDEGSSLFSRSYDDDETAARSAISVMTADDTESAEDTEDAKDKDKDEESKDADSSDAADDSSIGIESEGSGVNVAS